MTYAVHPAAAVYPMLPGDELQALADDIGANGLQQPLVLWLDETTGELLLLDGRNRLAACELAGVEPDTVVHDGDPIAWVLGANNHRRHMDKGQRALAGVLVLDGGPLTIKGTEAARLIGVSEGMVTWARTVAKHGESLIPEVFRAIDPLSLKAAYDRAIVARNATAAVAIDDRLAALEVADAELAGQVRDGALTLAGAEAEQRERQRVRTEQRRDARTLLVRSLDLIAPEQPSTDFVDSWAKHLGQVDGPLLARLDDAIDVLTDLRKRVET